MSDLYGGISLNVSIQSTMPSLTKFIIGSLSALILSNAHAAVPAQTRPLISYCIDGVCLGQTAARFLPTAPAERQGALQRADACPTPPSAFTRATTTLFVETKNGLKLKVSFNAVPASAPGAGQVVSGLYWQWPAEVLTAERAQYIQGLAGYLGMQPDRSGSWAATTAEGARIQLTGRGLHFIQSEESWQEYFEALYRAAGCARSLPKFN